MNMDILLIILIVIIVIGIYKCEGFKGEPFSSIPYYFPQGRGKNPMFPDTNPGIDTFARYCMNRNGDCEFGHRFCTCKEHGGCGWWADTDNKSRWIEFGQTLPCSRFNGKCTSLAYN